MRKDDARMLDHTTPEVLRERAVRSVQAGASPEVVARSLKNHDPRDGGGIDPEEIRYHAERHLRGSAVGVIGDHLSKAPASSA